jgi:hypothetical protein
MGFCAHPTPIPMTGAESPQVSAKSVLYFLLIVKALNMPYARNILDARSKSLILNNNKNYEFRILNFKTRANDLVLKPYNNEFQNAKVKS